MTYNKKKCIFCVCALISILVNTNITFAGGSAGENFSSTTSLESNLQNVKSYANWEKGDNSEIVAIGIGLPPVGAGPRGNVLARRAAVVDAYRNLAEEIKGVQVDADTNMDMLVITNDVVRTQVSALIKGAKIVEEHLNADGSYQVTMRLPLYGATDSVAAIALNNMPTNNQATAPVASFEPQKAVISKQEIKAVQQTTYTGVVVDAKGMGLESTFSPVIYDTNGRAVYGMRNIDPVYAISKGMVEYSKDLSKATTGSRAGNNPLVIKAVEIKGGKNSVNKVNVVVSVEDGDRILLANEKTNMLRACSVVFVK